MNICLITTTLAAPLAGQPKRRQRSHTPEYRKIYVAQVNARERRHGELDRKRRGNLLERLAVRSQTEVARMLGVSKEAVRQTENRALAKVRQALLHLHRELAL
jgi:DNA-directed RNA polymerase sigma subunit (sigma70/sigma32)